MLGKSKSNKFLVMGLQGRTTGGHLPWSESHERELRRAELDESCSTHHCQWPAPRARRTAATLKAGSSPP